jgi:hypothetical protein
MAGPGRDKAGWGGARGTGRPHIEEMRAASLCPCEPRRQGGPDLLGWEGGGDRGRCSLGKSATTIKGPIPKFEKIVEFAGAGRGRRVDNVPKKPVDRNDA